MVGEGTTAIFITFLLAITGYVGLTSTVVLSARGRFHANLWRAVSAIIVAHVAMVWTFRYGWDFSLAVRNGYAGFLMFHGALLMIVASHAVAASTARKLIDISFLVVTMGALGASFIYDVVAIYRIPVVICALTGTASLVKYYMIDRRSRVAA